MLPFSREVYFSLFGVLNTRLTLMQVLALSLSLYLIFKLLRPQSATQRSPQLILGLLWAGIAYFWFFQTFAEIHFLAPGFAILAAAQVLCLGIAATFPTSNVRTDKRSIPLILLALAWPLFDALTGPGWPSVRFVGLHPAPILLLTQAFLLPLSPARTLALGWIPLSFALVCAYNAYVLQLPQDWLPLAGFVYLLSLRIQNKVIS